MKPTFEVYIGPTCILTNLLRVHNLDANCSKIATCAWSRFLEDLVVAQLVKTFSAFYEIRRFINVLTTALYWTLS